MTLLYVDSHCHLDQYSQPQVIARHAARDGVKVIAVTELPSAYRRLKAHLGRPPGIQLALGFHPLALPSLTQREKTLFVQSLPLCDFVGEVGLDYSIDSSERVKQRKALYWILDQDGIDQKVLSVHSRGAERDLIAALAGSRARAVLHWYTGTRALAEKAIEHGLYFSINSSMLRTKKGRLLVKTIPRNRVLTETDGPYCRVDRSPATPSAIPGIVESLALAWGVSHRQAQSTIWENWIELTTTPTRRSTST